MQSRHAVIEDLATSLAQRRREVLRERARQDAYRGLAHAVVLQQLLSARCQESYKVPSCEFS